MRLERLLSIVVVLINRRTIRARELARMFEVSERTIYRDIEAINQAGIPVVTFPGANGGIGLLEGYRMEQSLLSLDEIISIYSALQGLQTIMDDPLLDQTLAKIHNLIPVTRLAEFTGRSNQMKIDLSPWGGNSGDPEILNALKTAIHNNQLVSFDYTTPEGQTTNRTVEPYCLFLKGQYWYLQAYCRLREDFRLFRLSRIRSLAAANQSFTRRDRPAFPDLVEATDWAPGPWVDLVLKFIPELRMLAEEQFPGARRHYNQDGTVEISLRMPEGEWLYGMILSYSDGVEVLEPRQVRDAITAKLDKIKQKY